MTDLKQQVHFQSFCFETEIADVNKGSFVLSSLIHTCHIFGTAIRIFDLKLCKNPYQSVSLIRSSS